MDNDAMRARVFVEFPSAGAYLMGVNSDDGFRVTLGDRTSPGKSMLRVMAPAGIAGEIVGMNTTQTDRDGNNGFGGPLPTTPVFAQAVLCDPISADTALNNAAAIAGKIAICQRTSANFATECLNCFNAGAIAVVGGLRADDAGKLPGTRGGSAATVTIPCIQISYEDGTNLIAHGTTGANSPLILRVSAEDCSMNLGEYSGGRAASDTLFVVNVPQAGVYPLSLVWENAGGDANCEWFTIDNAGVKQLINDSSSTVKGWTQRIVPTGARLNALVVSGSSATLSWTGEGELEYTYSLNGSWNKAANQNNPQSVLLNTPGVSQTFFRIRSY